MDGSYKISGGKNGSDLISAVLGAIDGAFGTILGDIKLKVIGDTKITKLLQGALKASAIAAIVFFFLNVYNTQFDEDIPPELRVLFSFIDILAAVGSSYVTAGLVAGGLGAFLTAGAVVAAVILISLVLSALKRLIIDLLANIFLLNQRKFRGLV